MIAGGCLCGGVRFDPEPAGDCFEVAAGLLDDDPGLRPDRHIFVDRKAPWDEIADGLPQLDEAALRAFRRGPG